MDTDSLPDIYPSLLQSLPTYVEFPLLISFLRHFYYYFVGRIISTVERFSITSQSLKVLRPVLLLYFIITFNIQFFSINLDDLN